MSDFGAHPEVLFLGILYTGADHVDPKVQFVRKISKKYCTLSWDLHHGFFRKKQQYDLEIILFRIMCLTLATEIKIIIIRYPLKQKGLINDKCCPHPSTLPLIKMTEKDQCFYFQKTTPLVSSNKIDLYSKHDLLPDLFLFLVFYFWMVLFIKFPRITPSVIIFWV